MCYCKKNLNLKKNKQNVKYYGENESYFGVDKSNECNVFESCENVSLNDKNGSLELEDLDLYNKLGSYL